MRRGIGTGLFFFIHFHFRTMCYNFLPLELEIDFSVFLQLGTYVYIFCLHLLFFSTRNFIWTLATKKPTYPNKKFLLGKLVSVKKKRENIFLEHMDTYYIHRLFYEKISYQ